MRAPCPPQSHTVTVEKEELSCSRKTRILLALRNIGVHQAELKIMGNTRMYLYGPLYGGRWAGGAENHVSPRLVVAWSWIGLFPDLPGRFEKFMRHSSVAVSRKKRKHVLLFAFMRPLCCSGWLDIQNLTLCFGRGYHRCRVLFVVGADKKPSAVWSCGREEDNCWVKRSECISAAYDTYCWKIWQYFSRQCGTKVYKS